MAKTEMVTYRQWEELRSLGCKVPPRSITKASAGRLLTFIKAGNGTLGKSAAERAKIALTYRNKYVDKRVRCVGGYIDRSREGVVLDLRARLIDEVVEARKSRLGWNEDDGFVISPFTATVCWEATESHPKKITPESFARLFLFTFGRR